MAAPESANNAAVQCAFITTLTLGIPHGATMALLLGALTIQGIAPGPQVMTQRPELFWGLIASMWIKCEPAPLILAFVLGPLMEENLRRALLISRGDPMVFITRPISAGFLIATVVLLAVLILTSIRKKREEALAEEAQHA